MDIGMTDETAVKLVNSGYKLGPFALLYNVASLNAVFYEFKKENLPVEDAINFKEQVGEVEVLVENLITLLKHVPERARTRSVKKTANTAGSSATNTMYDFNHSFTIRPTSTTRRNTTDRVFSMHGANNWRD